jgi:tRNA A37 threonylcarbamoyladenosine synthetase subunit TsaC/SUA5/YrdC
MSTSVHFADSEVGVQLPDSASMADLYPDCDFIIDVGSYGVPEPSTVVDMLGPEPQVLRVGKGDPAPFDSFAII